MLSACDLYLMVRRLPARTRLVLRTAFAVPRLARLRQPSGSPCRVALSPKGNPAPDPVARAADTSNGDAPRVVGAAAATGTPGPVVPIPPQRGTGAAGPAHTSVNGADAPSRASCSWEESVPKLDPSARGGDLAPADRAGGQLPRGCGGDRPGQRSGGNASPTRGALPPYQSEVRVACEWRG